MFIVGSTGDDVNEYALGTGFDVSTASFTDSFSVSSQEDLPQGIAFNNDGTKMFIVGSTGDDVNEYALGTGFDVSTASFTDSFSVATQEGLPNDIAFNSDGTKMFIVGNFGDNVYEYALATGFDVSTASFANSFSVAAQETIPNGIAFNNDGTKMFIVGNFGQDVNEYDIPDIMGEPDNTGANDYLKLK
jgi:DNA-binding beta-propeller fold protein YncE